MANKIINTAPNLVQSGIDRRKLGQERADFMNQSLAETGQLNRFTPSPAPIISADKIRASFDTLLTEKKKKEEEKKSAIMPVSSEMVEMNRPEIGRLQGASGMMTGMQVGKTDYSGATNKQTAAPSLLTGMQIGKKDYSNTTFLSKEKNIIKEAVEGISVGADKATSGLVKTISEFTSLLGDSSIKDKATTGLSLLLGLPVNRDTASAKLETAAGLSKTATSAMGGVFNTLMNTASSVLSTGTGINKEKIDSSVASAIQKAVSPIAPIIEYTMNYVDGLPEQDKKDIANLGEVLSFAVDATGIELSPVLGKAIKKTATSTYKSAVESKTVQALKQATEEAVKGLKGNNWFNYVKDRTNIKNAVDYVNKLPISTKGTIGAATLGAYIGQVNEEGDFMDRVKAGFLYGIGGAGMYVGAKSVKDILAKALAKSTVKDGTKSKSSPAGIWGSVNDVLNIQGAKKFGFNDIAARVEGTLENNIVKGIDIAKKSGVDMSSASVGSRQLTNFAMAMRNQVNKNVKKLDDEFRAIADGSGLDYDGLGVAAIDDNMLIKDAVDKVFTAANEKRITDFGGHTIKNIEEKGIEILEGPARDKYAQYASNYRGLLADMWGMALESKGLGIKGDDMVEAFNRIKGKANLFDMQKTIKQEIYSMGIEDMKQFKSNLSDYLTALSYGENRVVSEAKRDIFNTVYGEVREVMKAVSPSLAKQDGMLSNVLDAIKHLMINKIVNEKGEAYFSSRAGAVNSWKAYSFDQLASAGISPELYAKAITKSISTLVSSFKLKTQNIYTRAKNRGQYVFGEKTDLTGRVDYGIRPKYDVQTPLGENTKGYMSKLKIEEDIAKNKAKQEDMFTTTQVQPKTNVSPASGIGKKPESTATRKTPVKSFVGTGLDSNGRKVNTKSGIRTSTGEEIKINKKTTTPKSGIKSASGITSKKNTMEGRIKTKAKTEKDFLAESDAGEGNYLIEIDKKIDGYGTPSIVNKGESFLYNVSKEQAKEIWKKLSRNQN